jgi:4,5-DOPA dioxygenase extradiol
MTLPALFIGHGTPMNAITDNPYAAAWRALAGRLPRPDAILAISAHWETDGLAATAMEKPRTIHDFYGFPQPLFDVQYPAPGDPALVERLRALLTPEPVAADQAWGLDHGTWSVLLHMYPEADIPVVQFGLDLGLDAESHLEIGRRLAPLREEGVLILANGNVVHNLRAMQRMDGTPPYPWAERFDARIRQAVEAGDNATLTGYAALGEDARLAVPRPEHYLPLLYAIGARRPGEAVEVLTPDVVWGSVSMTSYVVGPTTRVF